MFYALGMIQLLLIYHDDYDEWYQIYERWSITDKDSLIMNDG